MEFLNACKKLISIDTSPSQGTVEAVTFLSELARHFGFNVKTSEEVVNGISQANILVEPSAVAPKLLLQTHLDTIDPGSFALWSKTGFNPFQASIRGDSIYGLGAADVKLDFICKLFAIKNMDWSQRKSSAVLLGTFGEEEKMRGALRFAKEKAGSIQYALIGEPTDLDVVYAGKGISQIEIIIPYSPGAINFFAEEEVTSSTQTKIFLGRAAHSSSPEEGENAVEKMLEYLEQMPESIRLINVDGGITFNTIPTQAELEFDLNVQEEDIRPKNLRVIYRKIKELETKFKEFPNPEFDPPITTINIGMIRTAHDHIQMRGAVRWSSHISDAKYISWMKELAQVCKSVGAAFRVLDVKRPFMTSTKGEFAQLCLEQAVSVKPQSAFKTQPVTNEANVFHKSGLECIVFGPGQRQKNSHTPEEHVLISDLHRATEFYQRVIGKMCP